MHTQFMRLLFILTALAIIGGRVASSATVMQFTNHTAFNVATIDRTCLDFEGLVNPGGYTFYGNPGSLILSGVTFQSNGPLFVQSDGSNSRLTFQQATPTNILDVTLPAGVLSVGFDFTAPDPVTVTLSIGQSSHSFNIGTSPFTNFSFNGFIADEPIGSIQLSSVEGEDLDNFTFGSNVNPSTVGSISGVVTRESDSQPISYVQVNACDPITGDRLGYAWTQPDGSYVIGGLLPGNYRVDAGGIGTDYLGKYYNDKNAIGLADPVSVTAGQITSGINFSLSLGGSISGTVTRETNGQPIPGLYVYASDMAGGIGNSGITQEDGSYIIRGLPSGNYRVQVNTWETDYISEYYNNTRSWSSAEAVSVTAGETTPGIHFSLAQGGSISGVVTRESDGMPISGMQISAHDIVTGAYINYGNTESDGSYAIKRLPPGDYRLRVETQGTDYAREYYNNKSIVSDADPVTVAAGQATSGINFSLTQGGSISGIVTRESDGHPVSDVQVNAWDPIAHETISWSWTQADGSYTITGLPSGSYPVDVSTWGTGTNYLGEAYSANPVTVTAGQTTAGIDFSLALGGSISGALKRESDGLPIPGIQICAFNIATGAGKYSEPAREDGSYVVRGLPSGNYRVQAATWGTDYVSEYYDNTIDSNSAEIVSVTAGQTVVAINFSLALGGAITGAVTRESGSLPIPGVYVVAYDIVTGAYLSYGYTQPDGSYVIRGLPSGNHRVKVDTWGTDYVSEYFNNKHGLSSADPVYVTVGQTTPGINFGLALGGSISGIVTGESDGQPVSGVNVNAYDIKTGANINYENTQSDGSYVIGGLPSGDYRVQVDTWGTDYVSEYYNNAAERNNAEAVSVTIGQTTPGINFSLALMGSAALAPTGVFPNPTPGNPNVQPIGNLSVIENYSGALVNGIIRIIAPSGVAFSGTSTATGFLSAPAIGTTFSTNDTLIIAATPTSGIDLGTVSLQGFVAAGVSGDLVFQIADGNGVDATQNTGIPGINLSLAFVGTPDPLTAIPASITIVVAGTGDITIHGGLGNITAVSGDTGVAGATVVGRTVTVNGFGQGTNVITVVDSAATPSTVTVNVTVIPEFIPLKGDLNMDGNVNLMDVIFALRILAGIQAGGVVTPETDLDADGRIGIPEAAYVLQTVSGLRE